MVVLILLRTQQGSSEEVQDQALLATVNIGSIENTIAAAGSLQPSDYVDVGAQVSGQLQRLYVEIGDIVSEGQLLAEIDARVQEARVEASRASIESLESQIASRQATLELARSNAKRQARLNTQNATSQLDYDNAMVALATAESNVIQLQKQIEQSRASLESEATELEFTRIYAPMAGTVVSIAMEEGRTLNASQSAPTILRIADLGTMTVEADISEADIGDIKPGMEVYFTTLGGGQRRWYGSVRQILPTPTIESNVVLYTGLFDVENTDGSLLPEMTAQVFFITASARDVLTVPLGAITLLDAPRRRTPAERDSAASGDSPPATENALPREVMASIMTAARERGITPRPALATVIDANGTEVQKQLMIGVSSRVSAEVLAGLEAGDQVVAGIIQRQQASQAARQNSPTGGFRPGGF
ncbi:efflux RND transporter periplasmic adaptor subunit [Pseudohongiella acticola]|uniref:efflux RND transporter periplasmic adaptor subunit n=1 Tax=Pseudohongiella acticola TaxID=1524254 RepID=UPI0030EF69C6